MKKNIIRTLPVMAGYIVLGIGFGIMLSKAGFGPLWALAMSTFIFAGSMQYVAVDLMAMGAGLITCALTALLVNCRHLFYGISMVDRYKDTGLYKPYIMFGLSDETYSLIASDKSLSKKDIFQITLLNQSYWIIGSMIGSLMGTYIPWDFKGVDFALTALFVSILTEQWLQTKNHTSAITGLLCTLICLIIFGASNFLIPSMISITLVLTLLRRTYRHNASDNEANKEDNANA